jgi:hypothetical protein
MDQEVKVIFYACAAAATSGLLALLIRLAG